jgi:hypothetical protein
VSVDLAAADVGSQIIRAYLSRQHFEDVENSCPMVALPTDVRRSGAAVRGAFETILLAMVNLLEQSISGPRSLRHQKAHHYQPRNPCRSGREFVPVQLGNRHFEPPG